MIGNDRWSYLCSDLIDEKDPLVARFFQDGMLTEFPARTHLIRFGEELRCIYLVLHGCVETYSILNDGRKKINLLHGPFSFIGISGLDDKCSGVGVQCATKVQTLSVPYKSILEWPNELLLSIAICQTKKMQGIFRQLREQTFLSGEDQVRKIIEDIRSSSLSSDKYKLENISVQKISEIMGRSRVQVSGLIKRLEEEGLMKKGGR